MKRKKYSFTEQFLTGGSIINLARLLVSNHFKINPVFIPRVLYLLILNLVLSPINFLEWVIYSRKIKSVIIKKDPVFILGYWRSGTTYLHNILSHDSNFSFVKTTQAFFPGIFILGGKRLHKILRKVLPKKRYIDEVAMDPEFPQEEEFGMANVSPFSILHSFVFPANRQMYFNKYVLFQSMSKMEMDAWKETYLNFIKKIIYVNPGKMLLLKSPANTARVEILRELFPSAKFIFIYRNIYETYLSNISLLDKMTSHNQLQIVKEKITTEEMKKYYPEMMEKYHLEKEKIPDGNLIEIRYEDLINVPLEQIKNIYHTLELPGFDKAEEKFEEYILSQKEYTPTKYEITREEKEMIDEAWNLKNF